MNIIAKVNDQNGYEFVEFNTYGNFYQTGHSASMRGHYLQPAMLIEVKNTNELREIERQLIGQRAEYVPQ